MRSDAGSLRRRLWRPSAAPIAAPSRRTGARWCWRRTRDARRGEGGAPTFLPRLGHGILTVPSASRLLRLFGFLVPCVLLLAGVQPLLGAAAGGGATAWAMPLAAPAGGAALPLFAGGRLRE